jgi:hypothetical protein
MKIKVRELMKRDISPGGEAEIGIPYPNPVEGFAGWGRGKRRRQNHDVKELGAQNPENKGA